MGVTFTETQANFILMTAIDGRPFDGSAVHEQLLRRGIIVRNGASLGVPSGLRVTIGTRDENDAFLAALAELIGTT